MGTVSVTRYMKHYLILFVLIMPIIFSHNHSNEYTRDSAASGSARPDAQ